MDRSRSWHGRLHCQYFWVDARVTRQNGRWLASVDTLDGPTLALGGTALSALVSALEPFDGMTMELIHSAPTDLIRLLESQAERPTPPRA